jgi:hypothetical protein
VEAHFYGKYGYAYFDTEQSASHARQILRGETNLVVSFAKSAPKPVTSDASSEDAQVPTPRFSVIMKTVKAVAPAAEGGVPPPRPIQTESSNSTGVRKSKQQTVPQPRQRKQQGGKQQQQSHQSKPQFVKFDKAPGAGRFPQRPFQSLPTQIHQQHLNRSPDLHPSSFLPYDQHEKGSSLAIGHGSAFGYGSAFGSIGGLVEKRVPFNIEYRAEESLRGGAVAEGGMVDEMVEDSDDGTSWNPFGFDVGC